MEEAIRWYTKAASQDNQRAKQRLSEIKMYNKMQRKVNAQRLRSENSDCTIS
jgi:TPR repeat protein